VTSSTNSAQFSNWVLPPLDLLGSSASFDNSDAGRFVSLRTLLSAEEFTKTTVPLGITPDGEIIMHDFSGSPGLLIAGSTGSGKSLFLDTTLVSLLYHNSPQDIRFILIDAKRMQFANFQGIPHLLAPIIYDVAQTLAVLRWLDAEIHRRFEILAKADCYTIDEYTMRPDLPPMPRIVLFLDELADLMMQAGEEAEKRIQEICWYARGAGVSLVMTTARPDTHVLRGMILANIHGRLAFATASAEDSKFIIHKAGAEKLRGKGDALYLDSEEFNIQHVQAPYIEQADIIKVTNFIKEQAKPGYDSSLHIRLMVEDIHK